jgi:predicted ArsR family transcriptional regulator
MNFAHAIGISAQELADRLRVKAVTVRYHLRRLHEVELVEPTTQKIKSPDVRYRLVKRQEKCSGVPKPAYYCRPSA